MATLQTIMQTLLEKEQESWQTKLFRNWSLIVGSLHTKICLERINDNLLIVGVHDIHWMQELHCLAADLVATINHHLGNSYVTRVRFVPSRTQHRPRNKPKQRIQPPVVPQQQQPKTVPPAQLTASQQAALATLGDVQLQEILQELMQRRSS